MLYDKKLKITFSTFEFICVDGFTGLPTAIVSNHLDCVPKFFVVRILDKRFVRLKFPRIFALKTS